ncbi:hypothetical protein ACFQY0_03065 [Haloferula chungangensis]|uniref:ABC transporter permease n=1 Tax=Haloferula chungangensis TaxID=1048331 RepID=A0ABW2L3J3_9BACT
MNEAPPISKVLRKLYLTLFLRGRGARGLDKDKAPKSIGSKLARSLMLYALIGLTVLFSGKSDLFFLSLQLHGMTLVFLALFVTASAGEVLFSESEPEILLHRPVTAPQLLWAKVRVMVEVSLWLAIAFNLAGLVLGALGPQGNLAFPLVHLLSTLMSALFCCGGIVLVYQLCLRLFGRERLENLMTITQVLLVIAVFCLSQIGPRMMNSLPGELDLTSLPPWMLLLPPAWFAGFDAFLTGQTNMICAALAIVAVGVSVIIPWLAVVRLAGSYQSGLQSLSQARPQKALAAGKQPWIERISRLPLLRDLLRDPLVAAGFRLVLAHLARDRDTKLRFYPGLAPILVMPIVFLIPGAGSMDSSAGVALAGGYLATLPLLAMNLLQFSSHWQATDLFRYTPMPGPGPLVHGARLAVMSIIAVPALLVLSLAVFLIPGGSTKLVMLLPGIIAMPVYAYLAGAWGKTIPFARPSEEARSAGRGASLVGMMMSSFVISGMAIVASQMGLLPWYLLGEAVFAIGICLLLHKSIDALKWPPAE